MIVPDNVINDLVDVLAVSMFEHGFTIKPWEDKNEQEHFKCYEFEGGDLYVYKNTAIAELVKHSANEWEIKSFL